MGIPIILGASERLERTGSTFLAPCPRCGETTTMYEAIKHSNVSAFLAISLWDGEDPVVQCGACLGLFGEEEAAALRAAAASAPTSRIGAIFSSLLPGRTRSPSTPEPSTPPPSRGSRAPIPKRAVIDESAIDAELAAMKKRLGK